MTVSVGGASGPVESTEFTLATKLFRAADAALYDAKGAGRDRCVVRAAAPTDAGVVVDLQQAA